MIEVSGSPIAKFEEWFEDARKAQEPQLDVIALATVGDEGNPSVRMVLFKGISDGGFVFFTNYESRKGRELANNPQAAIAFYWHNLYRQVRVEGRVEKVSRQASEQYFRTRGRGSQIGAWASTQSHPIPHREHLETRIAELSKKFEGQEIPCPEYWGGYRLDPQVIEFWQGEENRLHHRLRLINEGTTWRQERLSP